MTDRNTLAMVVKKQITRQGMAGCIGWASWLLLAVVFLVAGILKLTDISGFGGIIRAYGLVPDFSADWVALFLAAGEVVCGVGLLLKKRFSLILAGLFLLLFIGVLGYGIVLGLDIDCGCFSVSSPEHDAFSGLRVALFRDLLLLVPYIFLIYQNFFSSNQLEDTSRESTCSC